MNTITPPPETKFNARQFWSYKRLHPAKTTSKSTNRSTNSSTNSSTNPSNLTKKLFHEINGKIATDRTLTKRLDKLYIPPGYKDLIVAKSATNKIQIIGSDKKGRRQYIYNTSYTAKRNDRKYDDVIALGKKIIDIENDNQRALTGILTKNVSSLSLPDDYIPIIIYMLRKYHFRIGNERYADQNDSYGITTLQNRHIKFHSPSRFTIEFIGKKGIVNSFTDDNITIANTLKLLMKRSPSCNDTNKAKSNYYIFAYRSPTDNAQQIITPDHIQSFFQERYNSYITPKMFRTWYGNFHMLEHLRDLYNKQLIAKRMKTAEINSTIKSCSEYVSSKLNNTPSISRKSYIDNKVIELVMRNPYRVAEQIPDTKDEQHRFLYKLILKLRK